MRQRILTVFLFVLFSITINAQITVNAYARVTNQTGAVLTLTSVDETHHTFEVGEEVLLIQMQDDVLGDTTNSAAFGSLSGIGNVGNYEVLTISAVSETAGVPVSITLNQAPTRNYSTNSHASLQLVSFPTLGSPNYSPADVLQPLPWNGDIGGVLAFNVDGRLELNYDISADATGFRGGAASVNTFGPGCDTSVYINDSDARGQKGEGIYRRTTNDYRAGRAKLLTGGGGGIYHNGGGGGGGNYSAGGQSGHGWIGICNSSSPNHAQGGIDLSAHSSLDRLFMGGGGGGGHQNNNQNPDGGNGGGIIYIKAQRLRASCSGSVRISANGETAPDGGNDGMGGGGAGGNIFLDIPNINVNATCPIDLEANGGDGGNVNHGSGANNRHAGGGGGGQGAVYLLPNSAGANFSPTTLPGTGGCDNNNCFSSAGNGGGAADDGVFYNATSILPITLLSFQAEATEAGAAYLHWQSEEASNFSHFEIERSTDGEHFDYLGRVALQNTEFHSFTDPYPMQGYNYYRLRMVDLDGSSSYSDLRAVEFADDKLYVQLYPNPAQEQLFIDFSETPSAPVEIQLFNSIGQLERQEQQAAAPVCTFRLAGQLPGIYHLSIKVGDTVLWRRVQVQ